MKLFTIGAALAALCLAGTAANASYEPGGHITGYVPQFSGQMFFTTNGPRDNVPGCSTQPGRWVIDDTTPAGQSLVAGMLTAYGLGKSLTLVGTGDCAVWKDTETVAYFFVS